ncbi:MAG: DMT family transporter [Clostridia bacterium]|nr:DMT family transporter [Clostridia bacterium]
MHQRSEFLIYSKLVGAVFFWGGAFVAAKIAVQEFTPLAAAALRFTMAFLVLAPILAWKEGRKALVKVRDWPLLVAAALSGIFFYNLFFFQGLKLTSPVNGSLIVAACPAVTVAFSRLLLKEKISLRQIGGLLISLLGVAIIVSRGSFQVLSGLEFNRGDLILLGGVISWSLYTNVGRLTSRYWSALLTTTYACGLGGLLFLVLAMPQLIRMDWWAVSLSSLLSVVFLAVFASAIGFVFWYEGVGRIGAGRAAAFQNLVPLFSAVLSFFIFGDRIAVYHLVGAGTILFGVYLANGSFRRETVPAPHSSPSAKTVGYHPVKRL